MMKKQLNSLMWKTKLSSLLTNHFLRRDFYVNVDYFLDQDDLRHVVSKCDVRSIVPRINHLYVSTSDEAIDIRKPSNRIFNEFYSVGRGEKRAPALWFAPKFYDSPCVVAQAKPKPHECSRIASRHISAIEIFVPIADVEKLFVECESPYFIVQYCTDRILVLFNSEVESACVTVAPKGESRVVNVQSTRVAYPEDYMEVILE